MMRWTMLFLVLTLETGGAQLTVPGSNAPKCDWARIPDTIKHLNEVCCFGNSYAKGSRCALDASCDISCAASLLLFEDTCGPVLRQNDIIFDRTGRTQGDQRSTALLGTLYQSCMKISTPTALKTLDKLHKNGKCSDKKLNGVGETQVHKPCADKRSTCVKGIKSGFLSCEKDFCPTCDYARQCDKTCRLCKDTTGLHRRTQLSLQCDFTTFQSNVKKVNVACCDGTTRCSNGVPTSCDAKCAVAYTPFFESCQGPLGTQVSLAQFRDYKLLYATCTQSLPVLPLLRTIAKCTGGHYSKLEVKIYAVGGYDGSSELNSAEVYDPKANSWKSIKPMGKQRQGLAVAVLQGKLYALGGYDGSSTLNSAEVYDPDHNSWSPIAPMGKQRSGLAVAVLLGKLYAVGGHDSSSTYNSAEVYDPDHNSWSPIAPMGSKRAGVAVAVLLGKLYAVGGDEHGTGLNSAEVYDPDHNSWSPIASMKSKRRHLAVAVLHGKLYAAGGDEHGTVLSSAEVYDPDHNSWSPIAPMGKQRSAPGVAVLQGKLYAVGGRDGSSVLNSAEVYDPDHNSWSPIKPMGSKRRYLGVAVLGN